MSSVFDIAIIGAGPAGSVAAGFLARMGFRVVVLEKEIFPRFHIGESLLPRCIPILNEFGLKMDDAPFALKKEGAVFAAASPQREFRFDFAKALPGTFPYAYQVDRAHFDNALADQAAKLGADVRFGHAVSQWEEKDGVVDVSGNWGKVTARYLIDATGQKTMMSRVRGTKERIRGLGKSGTFTHFKNVSSPTAKKVFAKGDIIIFLCKHQGWGWAIPLKGDRLSIGTVTKDGEQIPIEKDALQGYVQYHPLLQGILEGAEQAAPVRRIADYSYYNSVPTVSRVTSLGDARGFLDPIFSSGITLAVYTAYELTKRIQSTVSENKPFDLESYHDEMRRGYDTFQRIIERFYRVGWAMDTFFLENKTEDLVRQITTILAGDVWRHDNPFQNMLLASQRTAVRFESTPDAEAAFSEANIVL